MTDPRYDAIEMIGPLVGSHSLSHFSSMPDKAEVNAFYRQSEKTVSKIKEILDGEK